MTWRFWRRRRRRAMECAIGMAVMTAATWMNISPRLPDITDWYEPPPKKIVFASKQRRAGWLAMKMLIASLASSLVNTELTRTETVAANEVTEHEKSAERAANDQGDHLREV